MFFPPLLAIPVETAKQNANVALVLTSCGGHIGFLEGIWPRKCTYMDRVFKQFVQAVFEHGNKIFSMQLWTTIIAQWHILTRAVQLSAQILTPVSQQMDEVHYYMQKYFCLRFCSKKLNIMLSLLYLFLICLTKNDLKRNSVLHTSNCT